MLLEYEGVQFVAIAPQSVAAGEPFVIEVHVQNCWNGARAFTKEIDVARDERKTLDVELVSDAFHLARLRIVAARHGLTVYTSPAAGSPIAKKCQVFHCWPAT